MSEATASNCGLGPVDRYRFDRHGRDPLWLKWRLLDATLRQTHWGKSNKSRLRLLGLVALKRLSHRAYHAAACEMLTIHCPGAPND